MLRLDSVFCSSFGTWGERALLYRPDIDTECFKVLVSGGWMELAEACERVSQQGEGGCRPRLGKSSVCPGRRKPGTSKVTDVLGQDCVLAWGGGGGILTRSHHLAQPLSSLATVPSNLLDISSTYSFFLFILR